MSIQDVANKNVQNLTPYKPGKPISEVEREYGIKNIVKLASNENPLGVSPRVTQVLSNELQNLNYYPDSNGFDLKQALVEHKGVNSEQISLGNGSDEIFNFILKVFVKAGDEVIVSEYGFAAYKIAAKVLSANVIEVPSKAYGHDLQSMAKAVTSKTKVIFVANPNNPTGTWNTALEVKEFLTLVPKSVIVVLDQAYYEFMTGHSDYQDAVELLSEYNNLIVTYTFSKIYGLAGLRVGYSISSVDIANLLNRVRLPFNVNSLAQVAAKAALQDKEYLNRSQSLNEAGLQQMGDLLDKLGLTYVKSVGNFILVDLKMDANLVCKSMLQHGFIIRNVSNYGLPQHVRISIGLLEQNESCILALRGCL